MSHSVWAGLGLTLLAGLGSGNYMFPMKFARRWRWENLWLFFTIVSLVVVPWILALCLVIGRWSVYSATGLGAMAVPFFLGAGWGIAQILFGLSVVRLGACASSHRKTESAPWGALDNGILNRV